MKKKILFAITIVAALLAGCNWLDQPDEPDNPDNPNDPDNPTEVKVDLSPEAWYQTNYWERTDREKMGLRGPVKKVYSSTTAHTEYEFDQAGHLISVRAVDPESRFGDWFEKRTYDAQGRLVKKEYGRTKEKGGMEYDPWRGVIEITEYRYSKTGKYVWYRPENSFDSRYFVNFLGPESRESIEDLVKDLAYVSEYSWMGGNHSVEFEERTYVFDAGDNLTVHYRREQREFDTNTETVGDVVAGSEAVNTEFGPIVYKDAYPYSGEINQYYIISSMEWRDNGMPLKVDGPSGLTEYSATEKRYINPVKWTCKEGAPIDALFGFTYWREWTYDQAGELTKLLEGENMGSESAWDRPTSYEYTYDGHGNWISYIEHYQVLIDGPDGEVHSGSLSRTIEYYE